MSPRLALLLPLLSPALPLRQFRLLHKLPASAAKSA